ncbi:MAG: transcriptional regulator, partial [Acidobacteriaceae bacterium]|nr:transcriptional regulator [Acidobacteriaceae bacterium]
DDPAVMAWLQSQRAKHATNISVCAGAKVIAAAGLLDEKRATTHWYYRGAMFRKHPAIQFVRDRRFVIDDKVATTTGITASIPMMLTLIEAIGGRDKAEAVARDLGIVEWDGRHRTDAFLFSRPFATTVLRNSVAFWDHDRFGVRLVPGVDEVKLALVADAWSRTYRSRVTSFAEGTGVVTSRSGMRIRPDQSRSDGMEMELPAGPPAPALDETLLAIGDRYGAATADVVAAQLEYPRRARAMELTSTR